MRTATFYFRHPIDDDSIQVRKSIELRHNVRAFVRNPSLISANGVNSASGMRDAYSYLAPVIDTDTYMSWLLSHARMTGCEIVRYAIPGLLLDHQESLKRQFQVDAIVNCAGLGSGTLAGEVMYPLRGALIRVRNDGRRFPRITQAHCVAHQGSAGESEFIFIVPRGEDMLVLGGLAEPNEWSTEIGLENYEPIKKMYRRCVHFLPVLENAELDSAEPVRVGLRPFRMGNVRLEREAGSHIIQNFGHGGSGVTYSWGCAHEVVELTDRLLTNPG
jgi:D-amino-acid oxidase